MFSARNIIVSIDTDRFMEEILATALAAYGWQVQDWKSGQRSSGENIAVALIGCSAEKATILGKIRAVRAEFPQAKIVLLGVEGSDDDLVQFIGEGANSYLPRTGGFADLLQTLEMVHKNQATCSGKITHIVLYSINRLSRERFEDRGSALTAREKEILRLINDGLSNKEIAGRLCISPNTVKNHVHHMLEKLKLASRYQAAYVQPAPPRPMAVSQKVTRISSASPNRSASSS